MNILPYVLKSSNFNSFFVAKRQLVRPAKLSLPYVAHNLDAFSQVNQKKSPAGPEVPISCVKPLFTLPPRL
ncbi:hypothetical protein VCRA2113O20_640004 [Vibrio crassostreae]|nr:hypothetical protein VCRA2119O45_660003 [Vibrio crassostreae]CAK2192395.1 hypothetical protein VCRA2113O20_640004 [Vibrio crassostreae]CAK3094345.1 hypothetical protein VCRA2120O56_630002 [Vibrio crassostreae]CAK3496330.1 hypothetical protein VCRA2128O94_680004 [Vibrio crassostreae]CAK3626730.1 hypothetical protein VCRA2121O67_620002 [Vibrio crassostreae]